LASRFTLSFIVYALLKDDAATERCRAAQCLSSFSDCRQRIDRSQYCLLATISPLMPSALPASMLFERSQSYWNGVLLLFTLLALALLCRGGVRC